MPTSQAIASTTPIPLWITPKHMKGKLKALIIDNQHTEAATIIIQDVFTPDPSIGNQSPTQQIKIRVQITVGAGTSISLDRTALEGVEFLGVASAVSNVTSTSCVIIAVYDLE
ncbi:MAG: hypothetical protein QXW83_00190 [Nitrososphaerales archaeon]